MPNWVYNGLTVEGSPASVKKMRDQLNAPFHKVMDNWNMETGQMEKKDYLFSNPVFAFWNIIRPTDMDAYNGAQPKVELPIKFDSDHWYDWNVRNWGTKWDVAVSNDDKHPTTYMEESENGENYVVYYNFETAWSPAFPAVSELSKQYPDLLFTLSYEEETGWGGEAEFLIGKMISHPNWQWKCVNCDHKEEIDAPEFCEDCGDYVCPSCGYSNDLCESHKTKEEV